MAKNKRCPLQAECEKSCAYENHELDCQYYNANGYGEAGIPDQEEIRKRLEVQVDEERYKAELDDTADDEDESYPSEDESIQKLRKMMENPDAFVYTEEVTGKIVNIPIELLNHHHDNPRKDLGDLSELTESIKAKGILQNLTVVPFWFKTTGVGADDPKQQAEIGYLVVIGNRRLEAAKAAGLKSLPCIISNMTHAEQVQTMLMENIQRADLTVYEQAHGFQMMLDFGDSVETISEKTGFSQTTVRRRIKLMELDQDKLKKASERQLTLFDLDRLNKVEDIKARNKILDAIGTSNFEYELKKALDNQEKAENKARWDKRLSEFAIRLDKSDYTKERVAYISTSKKVEDVELPSDTTETQYYFYIDDWGTAYLYKDKVLGAEEAERQNAEAAKREKIEEQKSKLHEIALRMYELRYSFIKECRNAKKFTKEIIDFYVHIKLIDKYCDWDVGSFCDLFHGDADLDEQEDVYKFLSPDIATSPERALLISAYVESDDDEREYCYDWYGKYEANEKLQIWLRRLLPPLSIQTAQRLSVPVCT